MKRQSGPNQLPQIGSEVFGFVPLNRPTRSVSALKIRWALPPVWVRFPPPAPDLKKITKLTVSLPKARMSANHGANDSLQQLATRTVGEFVAHDKATAPPTVWRRLAVAMLKGHQRPPEFLLHDGVSGMHVNVRDVPSAVRMRGHRKHKARANPVACLKCSVVLVVTERGSLQNPRIRAAT